MKDLLVVKIGSSSQLNEMGQLDQEVFNVLAEQVADIHDTHDTVIVSSGAQAAGLAAKEMRREDFDENDLTARQYFCAIGQPLMMGYWQRSFEPFGLTAAQFLITGRELRDPAESGPFFKTMIHTLDQGDIPIVNENDTIAADELRMGDNDKPTAMIAVALGNLGLWRSCSALLLTDVEGLYRNYNLPDREIVHVVEDITEVLPFAVDDGSVHGSGRMTTKLEAAHIASSDGVDLHIAHCSEPDVIRRTLAGEVGTRFIARTVGVEYSHNHEES